MNRGDICWYVFKKPDKKRPVLVLTRDSVLDYLGEVTVAPVTRTIRNIPTEILLTKSDGLKEDCAINLDHIQTVSRGKLGGLIATLSPSKWNEIKKALLFAFNLDDE